MPTINTLAVFCGSYTGHGAQYTEAATQLGTLLGKQNITLVYGGGNVGIMGILANAALAANGKVVGVMPEFLVQKEIAHQGLSELRIVNSMHERKATIAELADAFMMLPGGFGSLEEMIEITTWNTIGVLHKPVGVLNTHGFYNALLQQFDYCVAEGFIDQFRRDIVLADPHPQLLLEKLQAYDMPDVTKWKRSITTT